MKLNIYETKGKLGVGAAADGADSIRTAIESRDEANIILATGASQLEMVTNLVSIMGIAWEKVTAFHLDEYIGIPESHPASFRKYLRERFEAKVPGLKVFHYIEGDHGNTKAECDRINTIIRKHPIDVAFVGIGENSHLAFNDPPADFDVEDPYIVVQLNVACRMQQLGEGWFETINDVPPSAISMSIRQIMKSKRILVSAPDMRKASAIKCATEGPVDAMCPASILQTHADCTIYLDRDSSSKLSGTGG